MRFSRLARGLVWLAVVGSVVVMASGASVSLSACGDSSQCNKVRNQMFAQKQAWASCDPADPNACIKVFGNSRDCSGVLFCDFAVNPAHRIEAEQAVLTIAQQTQGCYLCAEPDCVQGDLAVCEPVSQQCIIVTSLLDASTSGSTQVVFDASLPIFPIPDASASSEAGD
jgi:hypothetical protein